MVTAATLYKEHLFNDPRRLASLHRALLLLAKKYDWQLEAWAVFSNHYHFIARGDNEIISLKKLITHLHAETAREVNKADACCGRTVWHNFWETKLTYKRSYLARLHYVHQNPVKHGLVYDANQYPWRSAAWFERVAPSAMVRTVYGFKIDNLSVYDEF